MVFQTIKFSQCIVYSLLYTKYFPRRPCQFQYVKYMLKLEPWFFFQHCEFHLHSRIFNPGLSTDNTEITLMQECRCSLISSNYDKHHCNIYKRKVCIEGERQRCIKISNFKRKRHSCCCLIALLRKTNAMSKEVTCK